MEWFAGYLAIGAVVGLFAGMFGAGGGAITVPLLVMLFQGQGMPREQTLHLAVGTSMAVILFTSISSVRAHAKREAMRWDVLRALTPGILIGGLAGSAIVNAIPTRVFAILFCVTIYAAATNTLLDRKPKASRALPGSPGLFCVGFVISAVSAFAAIGGAFMTVPFLVWCNMPMLQAIGVAAALGFPIALAGSVGFIAAGLTQSGLPPWSLGYIYLPALLGVACASMLMAPLGATVAHSVPTRALKRGFAVMLFVFATKMLVSLWG